MMFLMIKTGIFGTFGHAIIQLWQSERQWGFIKMIYKREWERERRSLIKANPESWGQSKIHRGKRIPWPPLPEADVSVWNYPRFIFWRSWARRGSHCLVKTRRPSSSLNPLPGPVWWSLMQKLSIWSSLYDACFFERLWIFASTSTSSQSMVASQFSLWAASPDFDHSPLRM